MILKPIFAPTKLSVGTTKGAKIQVFFFFLLGGILFPPLPMMSQLTQQPEKFKKPAIFQNAQFKILSVLFLSINFGEG